MWNLITLDGFFEGPKSWDIDWHESVWGEDLEQLSLEQLRSADMLLFGRVTYEGMASYWPSQKGDIADFMNKIPKVVFSRTLKKADWSNTKLVRENAEKEVTRLKAQSGKTLFIFGSANLSS
ncbi:MAG: riboflavin biosynthesis protein RibD, partial [Armatimonadetes bacterium 13_1_40CM_3_65_7]